MYVLNEFSTADRSCATKYSWKKSYRSLHSTSLRFCRHLLCPFAFLSNTLQFLVFPDFSDFFPRFLSNFQIFCIISSKRRIFLRYSMPFLTFFAEGFRFEPFLLVDTLRFPNIDFLNMMVSSRVKDLLGNHDFETDKGKGGKLHEFCPQWLLIMFLTYSQCVHKIGGIFSSGYCAVSVLL